MPDEPERHGRNPPPGIARRLAWFAALWLAGVATVGAVSLAIKWALK